MERFSFFKVRLETFAWFLLFAIGGLAAWWVIIRTEPPRLAEACAIRYARARTPADSEAVDRWIPEASSRFQSAAPVSCAALRENRVSIVPPNKRLKLAARFHVVVF
jgi:hypothetical protein